MCGIDSLLNQTYYNYKRGDRIKYIDKFGVERVAKYVMASSALGYHVLNTGGEFGRPVVVHDDKIVNKK